MLPTIKKMKFSLIKITVLVICLSCLSSCKEKKLDGEDNGFPLSETELINSKEIGSMLEYAIFDTTKIDFVNNIICDTPRIKSGFVFSKLEAHIYDSSYFFFYYHEDRHIDFDYIGMIYLDLENPDTICLYSYDWKYHINDFEQIIIEISDYNKCSVMEIIKHRKVGRYYVPNLYFNFNLNSLECSNGFVKKVIEIDRKVNSIMDKYIKSEFPNEEILIKPNIQLWIN